MLIHFRDNVSRKPMVYIHICSLHFIGDFRWLTALSSTVSEKDLIRGRPHNEKTDTYNLATVESGGPPALHGRKTNWLLSACTFIGRSHIRSLGNSSTGEFH